MLLTQLEFMKCYFIDHMFLYRHISTMEKRKLGVALSKLSPEDLNKALEIVAQSNLNFQANADEVELDIDAQVLINTLLLSLPVVGVVTCANLSPSPSL